MNEQVLGRMQPDRLRGAPRSRETLRRRALQLSQWLGVMRQRRRQRVALASLDDRLLDDIGVSAEAARREAAKPAWRA
jgi:uncharacterized protein YjiS (DUF1127 family)